MNWWIELFNETCLYVVCILHMLFMIEIESTEKSVAFKTNLGKYVIYLILVNFGGNILQVVLSVVVESCRSIKDCIKYCRDKRLKDEREKRHKAIIEQVGDESMPSLQDFANRD